MIFPLKSHLAVKHDVTSYINFFRPCFCLLRSSHHHKLPYARAADIFKTGIVQEHFSTGARNAVTASSQYGYSHGSTACWLPTAAQLHIATFFFETASAYTYHHQFIYATNDSQFAVCRTKPYVFIIFLCRVSSHFL